MSEALTNGPNVKNEQKLPNAIAVASDKRREHNTSELADVFKIVMTDAYSCPSSENFGTDGAQESCHVHLLADVPYHSRNILKAKIPHRTRARSYMYVKIRPSVSRFLEAVSFNNSDKVKEMIQKGMSPNTAESTFSRSALHIACSRGFLDTIKVLLENGANPNVRDKNLNTPLHLATCTENINVVQMLLDYGTNVLLKDSKGLLALEIAISKLRLSERIRTMTKKGTRIQIVTVCERIFAVFKEQRRNPLLLEEFTVQDLEEMFHNFSTQLELVRQRQLELDTIGSIDSIVDQINNLQLKIDVDSDVDSLLSTLHQCSLRS